MVFLRTLTLAAALASAGAAQAHVTLSPSAAPAGGYQRLAFGLGHGCDDQATTALRIEIPPGFAVARPQPRPGWKLQIETKGDEIAAVTWRGRLPADQYEEFLMLVRLPQESRGPLLFPAIQSCGGQVVRWDEPPADPRPKHPAPALNAIAPATTPAAQPHQDHH